MVKTVNQTFTGVGPASLEINTYSKVFYISVQGTISLSVNNAANFFTLPNGFHELRLGSIQVLHIKGTGAWQIISTEEAATPSY